MSPLLRTRKRVSSVQSPAGDCQVSPAKRKLISWKKKVTILDLPDHKIFGHSNLLHFYKIMLIVLLQENVDFAFVVYVLLCHQFSSGRLVV